MGDPRNTRVVTFRRNDQQPGFFRNAYSSMKCVAISTVRTFLVNLATRTQVNLQVNGESMLSLSCCNQQEQSKRGCEALWTDIFRAETLMMIRPFLVDFLKRGVLGDREDMVKVRYRYRYAFNDYVFEILPIGVTHHAIKLLFVNPIDTLYTRMITAPKEEAKDLTVVDHAEQIYRRNGIKGFYRGFPAALLYYVINRLTFVVFFDLLKNLLVRDPRFISEWKHVVIYNHASILADSVAYPLETIRANMMADTGKREQKYSDVLDCAKQIVQERGARGLFKGYAVLVLRHSWKWYSQLYTYMY
jgi:hypothetical protein